MTSAKKKNGFNLRPASRLKYARHSQMIIWTCFVSFGALTETGGAKYIVESHRLSIPRVWVWTIYGSRQYILQYETGYGQSMDGIHRLSIPKYFEKCRESILYNILWGPSKVSKKRIVQYIVGSPKNVLCNILSIFFWFSFQFLVASLDKKVFTLFKYWHFVVLLAP